MKTDLSKVHLKPGQAWWYATFIFLLTVLLGYFFPYYPVAGSGLVVTILLSIFIPGNKSTWLITVICSVAFIGFAFFHEESSSLSERFIHYFFSLLLLLITGGIVLYLKSLQQHISFDKTHLASLFENTTEGILLTDDKGKIVMANPASQKMFGYFEEEMQGNNVEMLLPGHIREKHTKLREDFYHHPQNRAMGSGRDLYARHKQDHVFPVEVSLSHYRRNNKLYVIAFIVDITLRKEIEQNLVRKQQELEKVTNDIRKLNTQLEMKVEERTKILQQALQKLEQSQQELHEALDKERELSEIKSRFVSMASHEFRTPLSTVLSSASLLSKYKGEQEQDKRDRHINRIKDSVKHLNDILEDFLSLGKLDEGRIQADPCEFNLKELLAETISDMKLLLKSGQQIQLGFNGTELIYADKKLLKNILLNLISNASKFSPEGSPIEITSESAEGYETIKVTDHGIGISAEDQKHLFSSFFRGANALNIQGTGLGLHIVKRYTDLMKGTVHLQSILNEGTTITIRIPVNKDE
jgi:PAS domain S-box-containing protein